MKNNLQSFDCINIKHLARVSGVSYSKFRNCLKGEYGSWTDQEKRRLYNALRDEVERAASVLGFSYEGRPIKPKD
jgi:hypothetical protein